MTSFAEKRQALASRFQMLQGQLQQAQNTVESTKAELAKIIGRLEQIAEDEKEQARLDGQQLVPDFGDIEVKP